MTRYKTWVLTDVVNDVWLDSFGVGNDSLRLATPHDWSLRKRTLRGGLRDGVDVIEVHNGALSYAVLPTRGMGLWRGAYRGHFLGWRAPVAGPVHPKFVPLYHCNIGPPFLEAGSRVVAPVREMAPRDRRAVEGIDTYDTYAGPTTGYAEQVYFYDLLADDHGRTLAMLYNAAADRAVVLRIN